MRTVEVIQRNSFCSHIRKYVVRKFFMPVVQCQNRVNFSTMNNNQAQEETVIEKVFEIDGKRWYLPSTWAEQGEGFRNFKARPEDVWIMTQPRSGTTLTQELVWLLANDLDYETAKKFHLVDRSPELDVSLYPEMWEKCHIVRASRKDPKALEAVSVDTSKPSYEIYADLPNPRIIKTHLALTVHKGVLDSGCKIIYVLRNPKDMLVSRGRLTTGSSNPFYEGSFQSYIRRFIDDESPVPAPYKLCCEYSPYWQHVKEAWAHRDHPNLLFMYYEEFRIDLFGAIKKIALFLGKSYSDEQMAQLVAHLDIDTFRKNPMVNELPGLEDRISTFIGKGLVGGWKEVFTSELDAEIDRWIEKNTKDTDIVFPYLRK